MPQTALAQSSPPQTAKKQLAFAALFLIEMWERFGYYGMTAVIVLFMVQKLGYSDDRATLTFGAFAAMVYAGPAVGGFIGDRILGSRRTTVLGAMVLASGYVLLAIPNVQLFAALSVVAVGNGLFKANPANLVSKVYEGDQARIDSAFTIYYMAVNLGAAISQICTPLIALWLGWHVAFAVCAGGLILGVINYFVMFKHLAPYGSEPDFKPLNLRNLVLVLGGTAVAAGLIFVIVQDQVIARWVVYAATACLIAIFAYLIANGDGQERRGLIAVLLLTVQTVVFFIFYQQMSTSLTLFAFRNVDLHFLFGYQIPAGQVQALNPIWIFILSPILAWTYTRLGQGEGGDFSIAAKFAMGFVVLSIGFFTYGASGWFGHAGKVSVWWMISGYALQSLAELLISGLGLAMVARYVGPRLRGFIMGVWFLATGLSQYLGSVVATFASVPKEVTDPVQTLPLYTHLFFGLGAVAVAGALVALAMLPLMRRLSAPAAAA